MNKINDDYAAEEASESEFFEPALPEPPFYTVAVFLCDRAYGGPEEGGWWYTAGERVDQLEEDGVNVAQPQVFATEGFAYIGADKLNEKLNETVNKGRRPASSVLSEGRYEARVC